MRKLLTRILAFIGFMTVISIVVSISATFWVASQKPELPERVVLEFDFARRITEVAGNDPLSGLIGGRQVDLRMLVQALDRARRDSRVAGLVANISRTDLDVAQIEEVRAALKRFTDSGRFALAWADSFGELGPGNRAYWLASAFSEIHLQPLGLIGLTGAAMTQPFARDALTSLGVVPDVHQRHEYKGAAETFTASTLSAPLRENYQTLLDDIHGHMVRDIAAARDLKDRDLRTLIDRAPLLGTAALEAKLIDRIGYMDETRKDALERAGKGGDFFDLIGYLHTAPAGSVENPRQVALVYITGPIMNRSSDRGPMGERSVAGADEIAKALEEAGKTEGVDTVVIRIDSPGGSVSASETIHRAIRQLRTAGKYVIVSMGNTAASGGYWIASAADFIIAQPSTITGSIGVVAGKMVIGPLSERLGINWETLTTGANSGMWAPDRPFSGPGLERLNAVLDDIYSSFTARVAEGRKLTPEQIDAVARGRVWSGSRAKELGLVNELGGLREALIEARKHMGIAEDELVRLAIFPKPESPSERVIRLLQQFVAAPGLNPLSWNELGPALAAMMQQPGTQASGAVYYAGSAVLD